MNVFNQTTSVVPRIAEGNTVVRLEDPCVQPSVRRVRPYEFILLCNYVQHHPLARVYDEEIFQLRLIQLPLSIRDCRKMPLANTNGER